MKNIIPQILIFLSLAVIVYLIGKNLPRLKELDKLKIKRRLEVQSDFEDESLKKKNNFFGIPKILTESMVNFFKALTSAINNFFNLIYIKFLKIKEAGKKNSLKELQAKERLIGTESDDWNVIKEIPNFEEEDFQKDIERGDNHSIMAKKAVNFFAESLEPNEIKTFSDGVVKIEKNGLATSLSKGNQLIKEVVKIKKRVFDSEEGDLDSELGVDRQILERKIISKITKDPRKLDNYRQLGELYIKMKNFTDAQESYKQIIKLAPRDVDAKRKLEKIKLLKRLNG